MRAPKPGAKGRSPCKVGRRAGATVGEGLFGAPQSFIPGAGCGSMQRAARTLCALQGRPTPPRGLHGGCSSGGLFPPFGLVQGPRPESLVIWLHLPARCPQGKYRCLAPADLSPTQPGLETWQSPEVGRSRFGNSYVHKPGQAMGSSLFSRRFPGQCLAPYQGASVLCSLLFLGTCCRQIYGRTRILVLQNLYPREVLSLQVVLRDNRYIS